MKKLIPHKAILIPDTAQLVFNGVLFDVYQWSQEMFDGSQAMFEMLKRPDTTQIICVVDDKIIVQNEDQPNHVGRRNFPGGRVDNDDDDIISAAQREVLEETGYTFENWKIVKVTQPQAKLEWFVYLLLAWDVVDQRPAAHEPGEKIQAELLSFEAVKQEALDGIGYLKDAADIFTTVDSLDDLLALPNYQGHEIDR